MLEVKQFMLHYLNQAMLIKIILIMLMLYVEEELFLEDIDLQTLSNKFIQEMQTKKIF
jgi:hypothetical protein